MKKKLLTAFIGLLSLLESAGQTSTAVKAPVSDLAHIDVILDSATWFAIKNDSFIQNQFGVLNVDTAYYGGKPSYDLYVLGKLNFLHISLAKGFWADRRGSGVLVFQSRKPGMKESILNSWKQYYKDSLFIHSYKGSDFTLEEVMAWYKPDSTKPKEAKLFANLTSYSPDAYHNWGITDSIVEAGLSMKQFLGDWGGEPLKTRLFNSITELHMNINPQEFKEIKSALLSTGYTENNNIFTHSFNPTIYITKSEEKGKSKYSKVKFKLNSPIANRENVFGQSATLKLNGEEGWFIFN